MGKKGKPLHFKGGLLLLQSSQNEQPYSEPHANMSGQCLLTPFMLMQDLHSTVSSPTS